MSRKWKGLISLLVCLALLMSSATVVFAGNNKNGPKSNNSFNSLFNSKGFKDVKEDHWAYKDIMWMFEKGIVNGIGNNSFNPNGTVTRAEFAKMMVNTLDLKKYSPETPSFLDVDKKNWAYPYVEGAKTYLTGWRTASGHYYKPSQAAVREDMAVALVNALGYQNETVDERNLNQFADAGQINPNLRKHVALAVKYGLMQGSDKNGQKTFNAQGNLTRAEAAVLLRRAFVEKEEKVTYDEDKVTYDDDKDEPAAYEKPVVSVAKENGTLVVRWNKIASSKLKGYKVVISKNDSTPSYPDNGYLYYITDSNKTYAVVDNSTAYNNGDFGGYLTKGDKYYFSVTALYDDKKVAGNVVQVQYDGTENPDLYVMPIVSASEVNGSLVLNWNKIDSAKFKNYRVVASKGDSTPSYPDNGYLLSISDSNKNYAVIDNKIAYTGGDFDGYLVKGEKYYFSITAVYEDRTVVGNVIQVQYNGEDSATLFPAPKVTAAYEDGKLLVKWDKINSDRLVEYRLVISEKNSAPAYPANGFYDAAYSKDTTSVEIDGAKAYTSGDFTALTYGTEYYFSVTAVYGNSKYVPGNAVKMLYLISPEDAGE